MDKHQRLMTLGESRSYFIYDLDSLRNHARLLNDGAAKLFFACKANPLRSILQTLNEEGIAFDVASEGELEQVLSLGIAGKNIIMTGPAKPEKLIRLGLENQIATFVIESPSQLHQLEKIYKEYGYKPSILLRLQLKWDEDEDEENVLGGQQITPFGMDLETAAKLLAGTSLPFLGFHVFQWGNILSIDKLRSVWEMTIRTCRSLRSDFQVIDVGGGLGIPYQENEKALEWSDVHALIVELKETYHLPEFWLEMGRYMTGPYGQYLTSVVDIKNTHGEDIVILSGGINHLARPALVHQFFPASLLRESNAPLKRFALHGPLCTSLDFLGKHALPGDIAVGDHIVFQQTGAYGFTESMPFFLCHHLPGEAVLEKGSLKIIREPQPASSWLR